MTLVGLVENGVVVFRDGSNLPDGTLVEVTPVCQKLGNGAASVAAREAATTDPFAEETPGQVSQERREALLGLIGLWKTEHPPDDDEVERIIEEARMKKYG